MASTPFTDIAFFQDTPTNRLTAVGYTGLGTTEKQLSAINPPNDSGSTPGVLYDAMSSNSKNVIPSGKILMRVGSIPLTSSSRRYPLVKNWRQGNTNTQTVATKIANGDNQLCLIAATNPLVNVNSLILPTPNAVGFTLLKLNFSEAVPPQGLASGAFTRYYQIDESVPGGTGYFPLNPPITFSPDGYNTYWLYEAFPGGNPYDDGVTAIAGPSNSLPTYIWFELTPTTPLVANTRYRIQFNNQLEYSDLSLGQFNPPF